MLIPYQSLRTSAQGLDETRLFHAVAKQLGRLPEWGELVPVAFWIRALQDIGTEPRQWEYVFEGGDATDDLRVVAHRAIDIFNGTDPLAAEWQARFLPETAWDASQTDYYYNHVKPHVESRTFSTVEEAWYVLFDLWFKMPRADVAPRPYDLLARVYLEVFGLTE